VDQSLRNILHFGDQVVEMAGIPLLKVIQLRDIYANAEPGVQVVFLFLFNSFQDSSTVLPLQIPLLLRANDSARVYTLTRPENPRKELGIVLHKRENKVRLFHPKILFRHDSIQFPIRSHQLSPVPQPTRPKSRPVCRPIFFSTGGKLPKM
jgi:hypothetical protein